jgi:hypothetical protein
MKTEFDRISDLSDEQQARYWVDCEKYGDLPLPVRFRKGPVGEDGKPIDPARKIIAVYPDGTFPIQQPASL